MKTEWDLSLIMKDGGEKAVEADLREAENASKAFSKKWKNNDEYLKNVEALKEALDEYEKFNRTFSCSGSSGYYYHLKSSLDTTNPEIKGRLNKIEEIGKKNANEIRFFTLNLSKIDKKQQEIFLNSSQLSDYKHYLENLFLGAKHILTDSEEKIMLMKESVAHSAWEKMVQSLLNKEEREVLGEDGKKKQASFSEIGGLLSSADKKIRDSAAEAFSSILGKYAEVAEPEINAIVANKKIDDELRKFDRPDKSRHLEDDIDTEVVDSLVKAVSSKYALVHRYYKLKAKLMGQDVLKYHERNVSILKKDKKYSFEEAVELVKSTLEDLDKEFLDIFNTYLLRGQIDVYPKKGKIHGAFCSGYRPKDPTYIMLNFNGLLSDIRTIAHELGHGFNNEFMKKKQNSLNYGTPKSTAEVASIFFEDFVFQRLLQSASEEERLGLIMDKLNDQINTSFRQIAFYQFETDFHKSIREKGYVSSKEMGTMFKRRMVEHLGESVNSEGYEDWWVGIPHFRYLFYVYSYASGLFISKALQQMVRKDKKNLNKVKTFLSAGTSVSPKQIFASMGIDITKESFWLEGINGIENELEEAESLAKKLKRI